MSTIENTAPLITYQVVNNRDVNQLEKQKYSGIMDAVGATFLGLGTVALLAENKDIIGNFDTKIFGITSLVYAAEFFIFSRIIKSSNR